MDQNYTPINIENFKAGNGNIINAVLTVIAVVTALVLVVLLFFTIQKKIKQQSEAGLNNVPTVSLSPTPAITKIPTGLVPTGVSSPSPRLNLTSVPSPGVSPTQKVATVSPTIGNGLSPIPTVTSSL